MFDNSDEFIDQTFTGLAVGDEIISGKTFRDCNFANCNFQETKLRDCCFENCKFSNCGLILVKFMGVRLKQTTFDTCKIVGLELSPETLNLFLASFRFTASRFISCTASNLDLPASCSFEGSAFVESSFDNCRMSSVDFSQTEYDRTMFNRCDLSGADFRHATGFWIDPTQNNIKMAKFSAYNAIELLAGFELEIS